MKLALIGYGALGRYIEAMISEAHAVEAGATVYLDDVMHGADPARARPFAGYAGDDLRDHSFFVCLGYKHLAKKREIVEELLGLGRAVPHFVHPSSYVHPSVRIGDGSMIYPGCSIDRNTMIGRGVWIANGDVIAHDCRIGDCCWFGASVTLSGQVTVGDSTFIGSGTTIANDVEIGSRTIIGLGTAVTRNLGDGVSAIGNPMRILDRPLELV